MLASLPRLPLYVGLGGVAVFLLGGLGWFVYTQLPPSMDAAMREALISVEEVTSYSQNVHTETEISGRTLVVDGLYLVDRTRNRFASYATTTLTMPKDFEGEKTHVFSLYNISIDENVYTKIETDSEFLKKTIPHSPEWRQFRRNAIPQEFDNIAIAGPILDNLKILSEGGTYVTFIEKTEVEMPEGEPHAKYRFKLSGKIPEESGSLRALIDRIGPDGIIDVSIDENNRVRTLEFSNSEYRSISHISDVNTVREITAPTQ